MATLLAETTPVSRGAVRCNDCGAFIAAGTRYRQQALVDDGRAYRWRSCPECDDLLGDVIDWVGGWHYANTDGIDSETFRAWADDHPDDPRAVAYMARMDAAHA